MSYSKQTWVTGDIVTAESLNHMEDGIADSPYDIIIKLDYAISDYPADDYIHLEKGSWSEIFDKIDNNLPITAYVYYTTGGKSAGTGQSGTITSYHVSVSGWIRYNNYLSIMAYESYPTSGDSNICTTYRYRFVLTESGLTMDRPSNSDVINVQ